MANFLKVHPSSKRSTFTCTSIQKYWTKMASFTDKTKKWSACCTFAKRSMDRVSYIWKWSPCWMRSWPRLSKSLQIWERNCFLHMIPVLCRWWNPRELRIEDIQGKEVPFTGMNSRRQSQSQEINVFSQFPGMSQQTTHANAALKISGKEMSTESQSVKGISCRDSMPKMKW